MKCLIVAAGQGTRLREKGGSKPLIELRGTPLIEHVIARALTAGITEFVIVGGYRGEELSAELDRIAARRHARITYVSNPDWRRANGVSVLAARPHLPDPFLLTMCDHLIDPDILRALMSAQPEPDSVTLAIDHRIDSPLNDPDDVTRVLCDAGRIEQIGKTIPRFNAFDTGAFLCTPAMFAALEASQAAGDDSISGAMTMLASWRKAFVLDVGDKLWMDVDDPAAFDKVQSLLDSGLL
jgi:1L-myo-inositol 1-phosphate cytidylyltransferase